MTLASPSDSGMVWMWHPVPKSVQGATSTTMPRLGTGRVHGTCDAGEAGDPAVVPSPGPWPPRACPVDHRTGPRSQMLTGATPMMPGELLLECLPLNRHRRGGHDRRLHLVVSVRVRHVEDCRAGEPEGGVLAAGDATEERERGERRRERRDRLDYPLGRRTVRSLAGFRVDAHRDGLAGPAVSQHHEPVVGLGRADQHRYGVAGLDLEVLGKAGGFWGDYRVARNSIQLVPNCARPGRSP